MLCNNPNIYEPSTSFLARTDEFEDREGESNSPEHWTQYSRRLSYKLHLHRIHPLERCKVVEMSAESEVRSKSIERKEGQSTQLLEISTNLMARQKRHTKARIIKASSIPSLLLLNLATSRRNTTTIASAYIIQHDTSIRRAALNVSLHLWIGTLLLHTNANIWPIRLWNIHDCSVKSKI